ncbi:MAG TPA: hypothetical protein VJ967_03810, partial [Clostridia bacterium]|nr:hypothetical protein [Clostridia bacterium]
SLPYYQEGLIVPEVALYDRPPTLYLRWGNWFVLVTALIVSGFALRVGLRYTRTQKKRRR